MEKSTKMQYDGIANENTVSDHTENMQNLATQNKWQGALKDEIG